MTLLAQPGGPLVVVEVTADASVYGIEALGQALLFAVADAFSGAALATA